MNRRIAILGASGHIGMSVAKHLSQRRSVSLDLYSRRPDEVHRRVGEWKSPATITSRAFDALDLAGCDIVLNAIGLADPSKKADLGTGILQLTLAWEERVRNALASSPHSLYVYLSSGAVYGPLNDGFAHAASNTVLPANQLTAESAYGRAKLLAETLHRCWTHPRVLDIRVFGYVSDQIDVNAGYLVSSIMRAMRDGRAMETTADDITRDFVGPAELVDLIDAVAEQPAVNEAVDIYSRGPLTKFALFDALAAHGFRWNVAANSQGGGTRSTYATAYRRAADFGYVPHRTSLDIVVDVVARSLSKTSEPPVFSSTARAQKP